MTPRQAYLYLVLGSRFMAPPRGGKLLNLGRYLLAMPFIRAYGPDRLPFSPLTAVVSVTARCDRECSFCFFRGELNRDQEGRLELGYERFLDFLRHPRVASAGRIHFSGGEPLLNPEIVSMISAARERGHRVTLITNGRLLAARAHELLRHPPHLLTVSYYPEDRARLERALPLLSERIPLRLHFVLSARRARHLEECFRLAAAHRACLVSVENMNCSRPVPGDEAISQGDPAWRALRRRLQKRYGGRFAIAWLTGPPRPRRTTACRAFWHSMHLDALGRVSPCCEWPLSAHEDGLFSCPDAWNSPRMIGLRQAMRRHLVPRPCRECASLYRDYLSL